jgi:hypothetical protein
MGERFIKSRDHAVILIFDEAGYIAGIQIGVSIALPPEVSCMHFIKSGKNLQIAKRLLGYEKNLCPQYN